MITGIECAGLVLAVLPIFIEAAKSYKKGVDSIYNVASHSRRDEKLQDFYEEFWWETAMLNRQIRGIIDALPYLSNDRKTYLAAPEHLEEWNHDTDVSKALQEFFSSVTDFEDFKVIMTKIVGLLVQLVQDSTVHISIKDMNHSGMYNKLKDFGMDRQNNQTSSSLPERLRFWRKEKDREKCLRAFRIWNKRLYRLIEEAQREPLAKKVSVSTKKVPSFNLRVVSQTMFSALSKCWTCECDVPHEAKICLKPDEYHDRDSDEAKTRFDFLFSTAAETGRWTWQEGLVLVQPRWNAQKTECAALRRLCDAINCSRGNDHCLQLLINNLDGDDTVWQLRSQPRRTRFVETMPAVSLQTLLLGSAPLSLKVKRRLALIFANSLLQLHEDSWLGRDWNKEKILFFYESIDKPDYLRPYITTNFQNLRSSSDLTIPKLNIFHPNLSILALGILLIELHTKKPIEFYRSANDLTNDQDANANTDLSVADRVVKSLEDCSFNYKRAIQACLDTPWTAAGERVSLDDPVVVSGMYEDVVRPLEDEIAYLFKETL